MLLSLFLVIRAADEVNVVVIVSGWAADEVQNPSINEHPGGLAEVTSTYHKAQ